MPNSAAIKRLIEAMLTLKTGGEFERFLHDLCTPQELNDFADRFRMAELLNDGAMNYRDIAAELNASVTTVTRVARFLRDEPYQGYRLALSRMKKS